LKRVDNSFIKIETLGMNFSMNDLLC